MRLTKTQMAQTITMVLYNIIDLPAIADRRVVRLSRLPATTLKRQYDLAMKVVGAQ